MVIQDSLGRPTLASNGGEMTRFTDVLEWGTALAETSVGIDPKAGQTLWEARGWKEFVDGMPDSKKAITAIMLENCRQKFGQMNEATRTSNLGTFDKWIFPVISNMSENDVIDQLVALQPMAGPVSQIVYLDIVTGQRKGSTPAGSPMWRALQGAVDRYTDSDETVYDEPLGTTSSTGAITGKVDYSPVRAGMFKVTIGSLTMQDDGNGVLTPSAGSAAGTISYTDGTYAITGATASTAATVTYVYDSEGNQNLQGYEMKISSTPVTARVLKLAAKWSEEAAQSLQSMYNIKAESVLLNSLTNALQYQKHRQVIADLRSRADAGFVTWDAVPASGVNYQSHKFSAVDTIETASNMIFGATNMVAGNWILCGLQLATVLSTIPQFVAKGDRTTMQGITYLGDLGNKKVFADPHYPTNEFIVGHKGDQFLSTGYVLAEYQKLYTTPNIMLPDFINQRGFATSFAKKVINSKMYCRGLVLNAPTQFGGSSNPIS